MRSRPQRSTSCRRSTHRSPAHPTAAVFATCWTRSLPAARCSSWATISSRCVRRSTRWPTAGRSTPMPTYGSTTSQRRSPTHRPGTSRSTRSDPVRPGPPLRRTTSTTSSCAPSCQLTAVSQRLRLRRRPDILLPHTPRPYTCSYAVGGGARTGGGGGRVGSGLPRPCGAVGRRGARRRGCEPGWTVGTWPLAAQVEQVSSYPEKVLADASRSSLKDAERTVKRAQTTRVLPQLGEASGRRCGVGCLMSMWPAGRWVSWNRANATHSSSGPSGWSGSRNDPPRTSSGWLVSAEVRRIQADDGMARLERQRRATRLRTWVDHRDGMWCLAGRFDPATGVRLHGRLEAALASCSPTHMPDGCPSDPCEKQDFLRAQALVALLDGQVRGVGRPGSRVVVDVTQPAHRHSGRGLGDPRRDPRGRPARAGRHRRRPSGRPRLVGSCCMPPACSTSAARCRMANRAQRRALRGLYATCAIPGCAVKYDNCKLHHVEWWENDGPTDLRNLLPLCERHHHAVHDRGWILTLGQHRELTVKTRDGQVMTTGPPGRRAA